MGLAGTRRSLTFFTTMTAGIFENEHPTSSSGSHMAAGWLQGVDFENEHLHWNSAVARCGASGSGEIDCDGGGYYTYL